MVGSIVLSSRCPNPLSVDNFGVNGETAEKLGLKEYVPAYRDQNLQSEELLTGVSFASGGSGYDPLTPELMSVIPISDQIEMFKEYKVKLKGMVGEERANFIIANSVALLVSSSNDIAITYFGLGIQRAKYDVNSYTDMITSSASSFVQVLPLVGIMQQSTSSSNNTTVDMASGNRSCCGHLGLEAWVSHTTRNYNRPYWRCKHCGNFIRWIEADLVMEFKELSSIFANMSMRMSTIEEDLK
ncbi:hypothetical protein Dimus_003200 [Dionaea muscipula]